MARARNPFKGSHLPAHEGDFFPNLGFGVVGAGYRSVVNVFNYYNCDVLGPAATPTRATVQVAFYDREGRRRLETERRLEAYGSAHVDIGETLGVGASDEMVYGSILCRMIPDQIPDGVKTPVSTEFVSEVSSNSGDRSFLHNLHSIALAPHKVQMKGVEAILTDNSRIRFLVFLNNYYGPRIPFFSKGKARVGLRNHEGKTLWAWSRPIPPRGASLFDVHACFPAMAGFLDGRAGVFLFYGYNLMKKPISWFDGDGAFCIDHF